MGYIIFSHRGIVNKITMQSGGPPCQLIKKFGKRGINIGEFFDIMGMAVDSSGNIYIVKWNNERLQVISDN